jgi:lipopolysaccharide biosynthesis regulator YciM
MRLIDADALNAKFVDSYYKTLAISLKAIIDECPTIDAAPIAGAKWVLRSVPIKQEALTIWHDYACSVCHYKSLSQTNYCPNCGAKMEAAT